MIKMNYVHGYSSREAERLLDQSRILENLLHEGTTYKKDEVVLEAGCGVGAQTKILAQRNPKTSFTSIDISEQSLHQVKAMLDKENISNVNLQKDNIMLLSYPDAFFDHIFVCFVLEHLDDPVKALQELKRVLKTGGSMTVIEGDHGSCFWTPQTKDAVQVWNALIQAQSELGHDSMIGRRLFPLLRKVELKIEDVSPRYVYADWSNPELLDGVVNRIIVPMVQSSEDQILTHEIANKTIWEKGLRDLSDIGTIPEGTFFYTWFKAIAYKY
jgi:ubiquinone/menaquinone biosynthesis C-methylase UbiE